jgi:uncharacterized membrane protein
MSEVVERNVAALVQRRGREENSKGLQDRLADSISGFAGSMKSVCLHAALFGGWIVVNLGWTPIPKFDPSFVVLAMFASVEAIFLSTFVMITQNRMQAQADTRADLDLHISLLAEHEITRLLKLNIAMARRLGIEEGHDPHLHELARDVLPEKVLDQMEADEEAPAPSASTSNESARP